MAIVLIIEPNQVTASQYAEQLERAGHKVKIAGNAQAAITQTDKQSPDLVLLELLLPAHSGIEFLYEFRSYPEWQSVPVLITSRLRRNELPANDALLAKLGICAFLYKPELTLNRLASRVEAALSDYETVRN